MLNRLLMIVMLSGMLSASLKAQKSFSRDQTVFFRQTMASLQSLGTEAANKVAFDYENAWNANFTTSHKEKIHEIALKMERMGYTFRPHFWYYFSYLAYSISQARVSNDQLTALLDMNTKVVETLSNPQYSEYLLGLNMFMARNILVYTKNIKTVADGGSFTFQLLEDYAVADLDETEEEEAIIAEQAADDWSEDTSDPWTDDSGDWGAGDSWGDSGDEWGDDSFADETQPEETKVADIPQRLEVVEYTTNPLKDIQMSYQHPSKEGPVINMLNSSMLIVTPYDSFQIKETTGAFMLRNRVYVGDKAVINWPEQNRDFKGAVVNLKQFYMRRNRVDFWTPNATLTFPGLFAGQVDGVFRFDSPKRRTRLSAYPMFTSNKADVQLSLNGGKLKYKGGIKLSGNSLFGESVSRQKGTLEILDGRGNTVKFTGERFVFKDSTVSTDGASFAFLHGKDSISHPSVSMTYDSRTGVLVVLRTKDFDNRAFQSTYFSMNIDARLLKWNLNEPDLHFSVLNGKDLIPAVIESDRYYNDIRFRKLANGFGFNPLVTSVFYANKYRIREFNVQELVNTFSIPLPQAIGAMKVLAKNGFADFNTASGHVTLLDNAFLYYAASARKIDFDNLLIPSLEPDRPNASMSLDSGTLTVLGVGEFYVTTDYKVKIKPHKGQLTVHENRNLEFDGHITTGDFSYGGSDFYFDYDGFLINMPEVDSIQIELHQIDTSLVNSTEDGYALGNSLGETSGTLYLDKPNDKSGQDRSGKFPYFTSTSDAVVYFDKPEILGGAYDKSVKFIIPPFEEDSLDVDAAISFDGTFNSGGIFPDFKETLSIMPDKSLGFIHQMPPEGYHLYGTSAKTYEKIYLSNDGIRGGGKIDFITSTIYSDDFVYYPDSVAAYGNGGTIGAGQVGGASYPEAVLGAYRMHWLPRVDSMYLQNLYEPFKFYNATAELDGKVNITSTGVFGSGTMLTRGSKSRSNDLTFRQFDYSARHADFEILTDNPNKPAMAGEDISLHFDLTKNIADVHPEKQGVAAISFPYAQMKTSITNAVWYLEDSVVTMTKPDHVPIEASYFYTTRKELDSLAFNAKQAIYDLNTKELDIKGIPFIKVADALIIPENNETTILENSELQTFNNAQIIIDTLNRFHYLHSGEIKILSRNRFVGNALYLHVNESDTFDIRFDEFGLDEVLVNGKPKQMTVSGGEVLEKQNLLISPGFYYKGNVKMYSHQKALDLDGFVHLNVNQQNAQWIRYERQGGDEAVAIDIGSTTYEDDEPVIAGLHYDLRGSIYSSFIEKRNAPSDEDFFLAKGTLTFDTTDLSYKIETPLKSAGQSYQGYTMIYNDESKDIIFEGQANFFGSHSDQLNLQSSILGTGNSKSNEYHADALFTIDFPIGTDFMTLMAQDLVDVVERLGFAPANDLSLELMYKLANMTSDQVTKKYEQSSLKDYVPLYEIDESLQKTLVISGIKMKWSQAHKAWYNTTKIGVSNINGVDVNAKLDGFLEIKKDETNSDVMNLFIQAVPGTWYFISYASDNLILYSSNSEFNRKVDEKSNYGSTKAGQLALIAGEENETLGFINAFREQYFGITSPFNLVYPDDNDVADDESFDTIQEEELIEEEEQKEEEPSDDGFGF